MLENLNVIVSYVTIFNFSVSNIAQDMIGKPEIDLIPGYIIILKEKVPDQ